MQTSPGVQNSVISGPIKRTYVLQNLKKKTCKDNNNWSHKQRITRTVTLLCRAAVGGNITSNVTMETSIGMCIS